MTAPLPDRLAQAIHDHRPLVSQHGGIVGCWCMDRVFVMGQETHEDHLTAVLLPVIEDYGTEREAKALREAADAIGRQGCLSADPACHSADVQLLRARANRIEEDK